MTHTEKQITEIHLVVTALKTTVDGMETRLKTMACHSHNALLAQHETRLAVLAERISPLKLCIYGFIGLLVSTGMAIAAMKMFTP